MGSERIKLSVIIPAYNEEANLRKGALTTIRSYLCSLNLPYEVLIVNDGSTDATAQLVRGSIADWKEFTLVDKPHNGKAFTLIKGAQEARGEYILFIDTDQATPISELSKLYPYLDQGYDVVIGSRGSVRKNAPVDRKILSNGQVLLRNLILGFRNIHDTQCGFKAYQRSAFLRILKRLYLFNPDKAREITTPAVSAGFDVEVLFVASKLNLKVKEVPVIWDYMMSRRVNLLRDAIRGVKELLLLKYLDLRGVYKIALI